MTATPPFLPNYLHELVAGRFGPGALPPHLVETAFRHEGYSRAAVAELLPVAKGLSGESWALRSLAVLLLEHQLLRLDQDDDEATSQEFDLVLTELGLKTDRGRHIPLHPSVLKEGYSTTALDGFAKELRVRLQRLNRLHLPLRRNAFDEGKYSAWTCFLRATGDIAKLTLARYTFSAAEVAAEVVCTLTVTAGVLAGATPICLPELPDYEAAIIRELCRGHAIYWTSERCGSELNALVEYPLTTAVVVIKPPGSDLEIEIKRAGTQGERRLNVIARRNGRDAPTSHRLFGGSLGWLAQREASSADLFARVWRLIHGTEAGCSRTVSNASVVTVPYRGAEIHLLDYLTSSEAFGPGFDEMREAAKECVAAFPSDTGVPRASWQGEAGLTLQFIGQALPQQAIIAGSSSFRIDRIDLYLSDRGPEHYFGALGREPSPADARWLAETMLEEILGEVIPPAEGFHSYPQYVRDALLVPHNRQRADSNYLSVMRQAGEFWGTLLALRGYSDGESFVQRNVGLKSVWRNGGWKIRIIFMDHDDLTFAGSRYTYLWPSREVPGMLRDEVHLVGGALSGEPIPGDAGALRRIYRIGEEVADVGRGELRESLLAAYKKTQLAVDTNEELRSLLFPDFIRKHRDFDYVAAQCLKSDPASEPETWKSAAADYLGSRGFSEDLSAETIQSVSQFRAFFERMSFLYTG